MAVSRDVVLCCISLCVFRVAVNRSWASGCMSVWVLSCALKRSWVLGSISLWAFRLVVNMNCVLGCVYCELLKDGMSTWRLCALYAPPQQKVGYLWVTCAFWRNSYPSWRVHYCPFWLSRPRHWNRGLLWGLPRAFAFALKHTLYQYSCSQLNHHVFPGDLRASSESISQCSKPLFLWSDMLGTLTGSRGTSRIKKC